MDEAVTLSRSHLNAMIDLRVSQTAAETILDVVCAKAGVEYILMERGVVLTTPGRAVEYLRQLETGLRRQWAAARVLFPEMNPELFAANPSTGVTAAELDPTASVPEYLTSGQALVAHVRKLLR
ncbi:MAG: hypothetical protein ACRC1K_01070, partial [Planctomycetia bacterium]